LRKTRNKDSRGEAHREITDHTWDE
jgi:hypothetical protein